MKVIILLTIAVFLCGFAVIELTRKITKKQLTKVHKAQLQTMKEQMKTEFFNSIIEVSDTFTPSETRTENQIRQDAVMQLKNEIANSRLLIIEKHPDGSYIVKLKIQKP